MSRREIQRRYDVAADNILFLVVALGVLLITKWIAEWVVEL